MGSTCVPHFVDSCPLLSWLLIFTGHRGCIAREYGVFRVLMLDLGAPVVAVHTSAAAVELLEVPLTVADNCGLAGGIMDFHTSMLCRLLIIRLHIPSVRSQ